MKPPHSVATLIKDLAPVTTAAVALTCAAILLASASCASAQENVAEKIEQLDKQMIRVQAQVEQSEQELKSIQQQLALLREQAGLPEKGVSEPVTISGATELAAAVEELREKQDMEESQLAAQEQAKVGSASKYAVTVSGMILMNGFVNTRAVDAAATPAIALSGSGSTGVTLRQSILGADAIGPHLFGAQSRADVRIDFDGAQTNGSYQNAVGLLRLRTAHAELNWEHAKAFFSFDRPLLSPDTPTSFTAVAQPALAWSGNLWAWNPQAGVSEALPLHQTASLQIQAAVIDVANPPSMIASAPPSSIVAPSTSEQSRWPGVEARVSLLRPIGDSEAHVGVGGFIAPHRLPSGYTYDSWAGTVDFRLPVFSHLEFVGSGYTGEALGGLGAGAYKDIVYNFSGETTYIRALDDMGGWIQAKQKVNQRLEFNEAFGIDNVPGYQLQSYDISGPGNYYSLARNRTFTSNVIYKPSAYLLYSIEYRRIASSFVNSPTAMSNVIGVAAGYRF